MPSPTSAEKALGILQTTGLDAPILDRSEPRWDHLRCACPSGFDLCDRFREALIGGAIRDAMGRANDGVWRREAQVLIEGWRQHYNGVRPHSALGYRPPAPEAVSWPALARSPHLALELAGSPN